ncbi:MAG: Ig domain-containing protein [Clostridia bacterium]
MYYAGVIGKVGSQVSGLVSIPKEGTVPDIPYVPLEGIALSAQDCVMVKGGKLQIRAKMVPYNATSRNVSWSSDKPDVVDIDEGGVATAYNVGTATITCTALDEETRTTFTETLTVTVTEPIDTLSGFCSRTMRPTIIMPGSTLIRSIRGSILQSTPAPPPSALGPITTVGCTDMTTIMPPPPACEISTRLIPRLGRRSNWEPSRPRYRIWPLTTAVG